MTCCSGPRITTSLYLSISGTTLSTFARRGDCLIGLPTTSRFEMDRVSNIKPTAASSVWVGLTAGENSRRILIAAFIIGVAVTLAHRPWRQIEIGDEAIWDYVAQSILRGQVPYRDVVEIKTPGTAYLSAMAIAIARPFALRDVLAVRVLYTLMVGLISAISFALAEIYFRDRVAALIAFLIPLASWHFPNGWRQAPSRNCR